MIQIFGARRTGTTMTHLMLGNASDAFSVGAVYAKFRPYRTHHRKPLCSCGEGYNDCIWRRFDDIDESDFHKNLGDELDLKWIVDESEELR